MRTDEDSETGPEQADVLARLRTLAEEYLGYVKAMHEGQYDGPHEWQRLSADRMLVHDELLRLTGLTRADNMVFYCQKLLAGGAL